MPTRNTRKASAMAAPLPREELIAVAREAVSAVPGVRAADLKKKLPKPVQAQHAEVLRVLDELVASGAIFEHVTAKARRFFAAEPVATLDRVVPEILARGGPMDGAALKKAVKTAAPGHDDLLAEWMKKAILRRILFEHAPAPRSKSKRYGATPDLSRLLAKPIAELRKVLPGIEDAGVPRERVLDAIRDALGLPASTRATNGDASSTSSTTDARAASDRDLVRAALAELAARDRPGALLLVKQLRARTPLDKERFDTAALALSREGAAVLHHHDSPGALSEEERRVLVADGRGTFYVGIAPRSST